MCGAHGVYDTILHLLCTHGIAFSVHAHAPVRTIAEAEWIVPDLTPNLLKTIAFRIKGGDWILAAVRARERIDYRRLAATFGVKRTDLRSSVPDEIECEIGFQIGGIGPFEIRADIHAPRQ